MKQLPIFNFDFHPFFKKYFKKLSKNLSKCLTIYIYIIIIVIIYFFESEAVLLLWSLCWCQCNLFHLVAMDNECLNRFWNFKTQLLRKCILILFLLWKWSKYIFLLKRCLELGVLIWNQLELLYSLRKEIGARPPFCKIFIIHPRKKFLHQNDIEFHLSIGHALLLFPFFF